MSFTVMPPAKRDVGTLEGTSGVAVGGAVGSAVVLLSVAVARMERGRLVAR